MQAPLRRRPGAPVARRARRFRQNHRRGRSLIGSPALFFRWQPQRLVFAAGMQRTFYNEAQMLAFARLFGRFLQAGDVVALAGALGSGKTTFVRGVVHGRLHSDPTSSPTFTFAHRYHGDPPIDHLDFYRIDDARELAELGLDELFDGRSIILIEWWKNGPSFTPPQRFEITIEGAGNSPRTLSIEAVHTRALPAFM